MMKNSQTSPQISSQNINSNSQRQNEDKTQTAISNEKDVKRQLLQFIGLATAQANNANTQIQQTTEPKSSTHRKQSNDELTSNKSPTRALETKFKGLLRIRRPPQDELAVPDSPQPLLFDKAFDFGGKSSVGALKDRKVSGMKVTPIKHDSQQSLSSYKGGAGGTHSGPASGRETALNRSKDKHIGGGGNGGGPYSRLHSDNGIPKPMGQLQDRIIEDSQEEKKLLDLTEALKRVNYMDQSQQLEMDLLNEQRLKYLIRGGQKVRTFWDIFIIVLSLFNCFLLPVDIAFAPTKFDGTSMSFINHFIDSLFAIDIIFNFRTTIWNPLTGEEILDGKTIAINYLKNRFIIDLLATIPLDSLVDFLTDGKSAVAGNLALLSMLKIIRILRFTKIISYLNATEDVKLSLKLFKMIFYLLMYIHWQACAWYFYTRQSGTWFPIPDLIRESYHFYEHSLSFTYCFSIFHSVCILSGEDMVPSNSHEAIVVSTLLILSEFIRAHILGTIGVFIQSLSRKSTKFQEQIEFATNTMKTIKVNYGLQYKVLDYLSKKFNELDTLKDLDQLMSMLPANLRNEVTQHMFLSAIFKISVFKNNSDAIEYILQNVEAVQFLPDDYIIKQGQKATHIFILAQGQCDIYVRDQFRKESFVHDMSPGTLFGEIALLNGTRRTASVRCKDQCTVGLLSADAFYDLCENFPEIEAKLRQESREYKDPWKMYQIKILSSVSYLKSVPQDVREDLHYRLIQENHEEGGKVFNRGTECDQLVFVIGGEMQLVVEQNGKEYLLESLGPGSVVGTYSIINKSAYEFSAKAKTPLQLLILKRQDLMEAAEEYESLTEGIEEASEFIADNEVPICDYFILQNQGLKVGQTNSEKVQQLFKNAIRKVMVLNRRKDLPYFKLYELISYIKAEKKRLSRVSFSLAGVAQLTNQGDGGSSYMRKVTQMVGGQQLSAFNNTSSFLKQNTLQKKITISPFQRKGTLMNNNTPLTRQGTLLGEMGQGPPPTVNWNNISDQPGNGGGFSRTETLRGRLNNTLDIMDQKSQGKMQIEMTKQGTRIEQLISMMTTLLSDVTSVKQALKITSNSTSAGISKQSTNAKQYTSSNTVNQFAKKMSGIVEEEEDDKDEESEKEKSSDYLSSEGASSVKEDSSVKSDFSLKAPTPQSANRQRNSRRMSTSPQSLFAHPNSNQQRQSGQRLSGQIQIEKKKSPKKSSDSLFITIPLQTSQERRASMISAINSKDPNLARVLSKKDNQRSSMTLRDGDSSKRSHDLQFANQQQTPQTQRTKSNVSAIAPQDLTGIGSSIGMIRPEIQSVVDALMKQSGKTKTETTAPGEGGGGAEDFRSSKETFSLDPKIVVGIENQQNAALNISNQGRGGASIQEERSPSFNAANNEQNLSKSSSNQSLILMKALQEKTKSMNANSGNNISQQIQKSQKFDPLHIQSVMNMLKLHHHQSMVNLSSKDSQNLSGIQGGNSYQQNLNNKLKNVLDQKGTTPVFNGAGDASDTSSILNGQRSANNLQALQLQHQSSTEFRYQLTEQVAVFNDRSKAILNPTPQANEVRRYSIYDKNFREMSKINKDAFFSGSIKVTAIPPQQRQKPNLSIETNQNLISSGQNQLQFGSQQQKFTPAAAANNLSLIEQQPIKQLLTPIEQSKLSMQFGNNTQYPYLNDKSFHNSSQTLAPGQVYISLASSSTTPLQMQQQQDIVDKRQTLSTVYLVSDTEGGGGPNRPSGMHEEGGGGYGKPNNYLKSFNSSAANDDSRGGEDTDQSASLEAIDIKQHHSNAEGGGRHQPRKSALSTVLSEMLRVEQTRRDSKTQIEPPASKAMQAMMIHEDQEKEEDEEEESEYYIDPAGKEQQRHWQEDSNPKDLETIQTEEDLIEQELENLINRVDK